MTLSRRDLRDALTFIEPVAADLPVAPRWLQRLRAVANPGRPSPKKVAAKKERRAKKAEKSATKREHRDSAYEPSRDRAGLICECGCGRWFKGFMGKAEPDHFFGRSRSETAETVWWIRSDCHLAKTRNDPDRAVWLRKFIAHCEKYAALASSSAEASRWFEAAERARHDLATAEAKNALPAAPSLHVSTRQLEVLREIAKACDSGLPPTVRELGKALAIGSTNAVKDHLKALVAKGLVVSEPQKARAIRVTEYGQALLGKLGGVR